MSRSASHSEREKFVALIQQHAAGEPGERYSFAQRMMRYGATYGRLQEQDCNVGLSDAERKKECNLALAMAELTDKFGCKVHLSGDPRGNTVKIVVPSGYTNDWGREGICVPTS